MMLRRLILVALVVPVAAQTLPLRQPAQAGHPFTVVGERGAVLGSQDGVFEVWQNPVKVLRNLRITARPEHYDAVLPMNTMPATIAVSPAETVITLAHAAVTVREHLLVDRSGALSDSHALAYFEMHAVRPVDLVFTFEPAMERQWPAPNFGAPGSGWRTVPSGSGYLLYTDNPGFFGVVALPGATAGPTAPYQERSHAQPMEMHLHFDPARDEGRLYPLLTGVFSTAAPSTAAEQDAALGSVLAQQALIPTLVRANEGYYRGFFERSLVLTTPDAEFNEAFRWAEISVDQSRIRSAEGIGLAAGWSASDDSARPGFGWFFGRDTLWSTYAINAYGDFGLTRSALDFLLLHQRADGKMMHEYSQTAGTVDWAALPYLYASADSTPLLLMAMRDYVRASGDVAYLRQHWDNVLRAARFIAAHREDGLYSNSEGTGWVEEWPGIRPHQEVYLAALDLEASRALAAMALWMKDAAMASNANSAASIARKALAGYRQADGLYAFSRNAGGSFDATRSIFPAVAWWDTAEGLPDASTMLDAWAASPFSVDWGIRSVPAGDAIYDPISYHHGSVWPLYTGWVAMAEFRAGRTLQANERMRQTLALYQLQDPGATTEVLSGEFLEALPRSSTHQLWSSAMAIQPVVRGLLGLEPDALLHRLRVDPHLPASWDRVAAEHLRIGADRLDVSMVREGQMLRIEARSKEPTVLCLSRTEVDTPCDAAPALRHTLTIPLPVVEVDFAATLPAEGERSRALHVLHQTMEDHALTLELEAPAGSVQTLSLRRNLAGAKVKVEGGTLSGDAIAVSFPPGSGYVSQRLTVHW